MKPTPLLFNRAALQEIDRRAVDEFSIPILLLMENAGRAVAQAALRHLKPNAAVALLCGPGNNGADGLVAARHLHNAHIPTHIFLLESSRETRGTGVPPVVNPTPQPSAPSPFTTQLTIIQKMHLPIEILTPTHPELRDWLVEGSPNDLLIDALFGTGLSRPLAAFPLEIIRAANASRRTILSIDIPSGLDCDAGAALLACPDDAIRAAETISFSGTKLGFTQPAAAPFTGKITIADISAPRELLHQLALP